ncbi:MAG: hypothetical protein ABR499_03535 [Gemmatimonadaceae bacterium]
MRRRAAFTDPGNYVTPSPALRHRRSRLCSHMHRFVLGRTPLATFHREVLATPVVPPADRTAS